MSALLGGGVSSSAQRAGRPGRSADPSALRWGRDGSQATGASVPRHRAEAGDDTDDEEEDDEEEDDEEEAGLGEAPRPVTPPRPHVTAGDDAVGREQEVRRTADRILESLVARHTGSGRARETSEASRVRAAIEYSATVDRHGAADARDGTRSAQLAALELILHGYRGGTRSPQEPGRGAGADALPVSRAALSGVLVELQDGGGAPLDAFAGLAEAPATAPRSGPFAGLLPSGGLSSRVAW